MNKVDLFRLAIVVISIGSITPCQAKVSKSESDLVCNIARDGMLEVNLAKIASINAESKSVKDFAAHMMSDHSAINEQLKDAARKDDLELPNDLTAEQKEKENSLKSLKRAAFDRQYMSEMVIAHKKAITAISEEANSGSGYLKAWAEKTLPIIKEHKHDATSVDTKISVEK